MPEHERRQFHRILFDIPATLNVKDHTTEVRLIDISLKGALVQIETDWQPTTKPLELQIRLDDEEAQIKMQCHAVHQEAQRLGLQCIEIDLDSITHLRRLVELNSTDPALLERELEELLR